MFDLHKFISDETGSPLDFNRPHVSAKVGNVKNAAVNYDIAQDWRTQVEPPAERSIADIHTVKESVIGSKIEFVAV